MCDGFPAEHTCAGRIWAGPGESVLTHSGRAALQLEAASTGKLTGGAIVVSVPVALHVAVVRRKQGAAAPHYQHRNKTEYTQKDDKKRHETSFKHNLISFMQIKRDHLQPL